MGGKAIPKSVPMNSKQLQSVEKAFTFLFSNDFPKVNKKPIGSYLKKPDNASYGDLDYMVEVHDVELRDQIVDWCIDNFFNVVYNKGTNILSLGLRFDLESMAQIDLILTDDLEFTEWMFYTSDHTESDWKGLYRNSLISSLTHRKFSDCADSYERYLLNFNTGLHYCEYSKLQKNGTPYKRPKEISRNFITKDPQEICKRLHIEELFNSNKYFTYEDLLEHVINNNYTKYALYQHIKDLAKKPIHAIPRRLVELHLELLNE